MAKKPVAVKLIDHKNEIHVLKDVQVPEKFFNRMALGVQVLDEIFGGQDFPGILPGASILFTGMPGAGKSTAALQFADLLQRNAGRNILYNVGEEAEPMVAMRARRLGIKAEFCVSTFDDVDTLIQACRETGVEVLFQDSLQSLVCKEVEDASPRERLKRITKKLHKFAKDDNVSIFIIGHITKGGDFAGPMEIKHDVDIHAHIRLNPDTMAREFQLTKNRFGPAGIPYECNLSQTGLDFAELKLVENKPEEKAGSGAGKAGERRENARNLIKEALLAGIPVPERDNNLFKGKDGQVGFDCSGGFWNAQVTFVVQNLKAEGHIVGNVRVDGKNHFNVEI